MYLRFTGMLTLEVAKYLSTYLSTYLPTYVTIYLPSS